MAFIAKKKRSVVFIGTDACSLGLTVNALRNCGSYDDKIRLSGLFFDTALLISLRKYAYGCVSIFCFCEVAAGE